MTSDGDSVRPRTSRFKEGTMNSTTSIHAPPDNLWQDLGIDKLIDKFNEENNAPPISKKTDPTRAASSSSAAASEGTFSRFSRAVTSLFSGGGFSSLGKRKAGSDNVEKDDRKKQAEAAYAEAKELGLLPTPKVFVRPTAKPRRNVHALADTPTPALSEKKTPTPTLHKSPSKKDLQKQKKLSKRVSDLEYKLAEARKELCAIRSGNNENIPPVPILPGALPPTPNTSHFWSENEPSPHDHIKPTELTPSLVDKPAAKITKKRKASSEDQDYKPIPTDSDMSLDSEREVKRSKTIKKKRSSKRLNKKKSTPTTKEGVVIVVPDGVTVPPIPTIPNGVDGKRVAVSDDGFGGLGHEIF